MIHRRAERPPRPPLAAWLRAVGFTLALSLLVAWGVGDEGHLLPFAVIGTAGLGLGALYWLFPRGLHFAFGTAAGLALYTFGSKRVPAAEATLLAALEVPVTPLWVFVFLGEVPAPQTLLGGGIVLAALFMHILSEFRRRPSAAA